MQGATKQQSILLVLLFEMCWTVWSTAGHAVDSSGVPENRAGLAKADTNLEVIELLMPGVHPTKVRVRKYVNYGHMLQGTYMHVFGMNHIWERVPENTCSFRIHAEGPGNTYI